MAKFLEAQILNIFHKPEFTNKETGEFTARRSSIQLYSKDYNKEGEVVYKIINCDVFDDKEYVKNLGATVLVPITESNFNGQTFTKIPEGAQIRVLSAPAEKKAA